MQIARVDLVKTSNQPDVAYGTPARWTITVHNPGTAELRSVAVSDPLSPNCVRSGIRIPAGESHSYECSSPNLTQGMTNSASAEGLAGSPNQTALRVTETDLTNNQASVKVSGIRLTQTANVPAARPGETVRLTYTIFNELETVLNPVSLSNPQFPSCDSTSLGPIAPGSSKTHTCDVVVNEPVTSTATVTGISPSGVQVTSTDSLRLETKDIQLDKRGTTTDVNANNLLDAAQVIPIHKPSLSLEKTADVSDSEGTPKTQLSAVGDQVSYTFTVRNTGNAVLDDITLIDAMTGLDFEAGCGLLTGSTLEVGAEASCTASYTITQADLDAPDERLTNTASLTASDRNDDPIALPDPASAPVTVAVAPKLTLTKQSTTDEVQALGEVVPYRYTISNTGNVTVSQIELIDQMAGIRDLNCGASPFELAPDESRECTASHLVTQSELDAGQVGSADVQAEVIGKRPSGAALTDAERGFAHLVIDTFSDAQLSISKQATVSEVDAIGDVIGYQITITNTGNVSLYDVQPDDGMLGLTDKQCPGVDDIPVSRLRPGASFTCTANYKTTADDFDAQQIVNTAQAFATDPQGKPVKAATDEIIVTANSHPAATISKIADVSTVTGAGEQINYTVQVRNTGNVSITGLNIAESMPGLELVCGAAQTPPPASLAAGRTLTCTATHTVTQGEIDTGTIINTARLTGQTVAGALPDNLQSTTVVTAQQLADLQLTKRASVSTVDEVGDPITYTFVATNAGNTTLVDLELTDPMAGLSELNCPSWPADDFLAPGESVSCTADYTTTHADLERGIITNTAEVTASTLGDGAAQNGRMQQRAAAEQLSNTASAAVIAIYNPALSLSMQIDGPENWAAGDELTFRYTVTNTGSLDAHQVDLVDPLAGLGELSCPQTTLPKGESMVCQASYTVSQADADIGRITSTATVDANEITGEALAQVSARAVTSTELLPAMELDKVADRTEVSQVGQIIKYSFTGTNTGQVTIRAAT